MQSRGFVTNGLAIMGLLAMVFLSQLVFFRPMVKNVFSQGQGIKDKIPYANVVSDWFANTVYAPLSGASGEVTGQADNLADTFKDQVQQEIVEQKNNLQKNSVDAVKKAVAEKILSALGIKPQDLVDQATLQATVCPK